MFNKEEIAKEIFITLIKSQDEEARKNLSASGKSRKSLAKLAFGLAEAFMKEYDVRTPNKIPWES